jgi:hypothetical protein
MSNKTLVAIGLACMALIPATPASANLTDINSECRKYAKKAMYQIDIATTVGKLPEDGGGRWVADYQAHYGWCVSIKARPDWLASETKARQKQLKGSW